jgi:hypothetical protein
MFADTRLWTLEAVIMFGPRYNLSRCEQRCGTCHMQVMSPCLQIYAALEGIGWYGLLL